MYQAFYRNFIKLEKLSNILIFDKCGHVFPEGFDTESASGPNFFRMV